MGDDEKISPYSDIFEQKIQRNFKMYQENLFSTHFLILLSHNCWAKNRSTGVNAKGPAASLDTKIDQIDLCH